MSNSIKILEVLMKLDGKESWICSTDLSQCWYSLNPHYSSDGCCEGKLKVRTCEDKFIVICSNHDRRLDKSIRRWEKFDFNFEGE